MADQKISELDGAGDLTGEEVIPVVRDGETLKTKVKRIAKYMELKNEDDDPDEDTEPWGLRAWGSFDPSGTSVGDNIPGGDKRTRGVNYILHAAEGIFLVNLKGTIGNDFYAPAANCRFDGTNPGGRGDADCEIVNGAIFRIRCYNASGNLADPAQVSFTVVG